MEKYENIFYQGVNRSQGVSKCGFVKSVSRQKVA